MSSSLTPDNLSALRERATLKLRAGGPPDASRFDAAAALEVLMRWAGSPDSATDALALLHELQVHQVELDLQAEELRASREAAEYALAQQMLQFDYSPAGYVNLDATGHIMAANRTALRLLWLTRSSLRAQAFGTLLDPSGLPVLERMLMAARAGAIPRTHVLPLPSATGELRLLHATATQDGAQTGYVLALMAAPQD